MSEEYTRENDTEEDNNSLGEENELEQIPDKKSDYNPYDTIPIELRKSMKPFEAKLLKMMEENSNKDRLSFGGTHAEGPIMAFGETNFKYENDDDGWGNI